MATMKAILDEVLSEIAPTARPPEVEDILEAINKELRKRKIKAVAHFGGSFAKDTWLLGDHDVDIFVAFEQTFRDKPISDILEKAIAFLKPTRVHGSRDYFQTQDHYAIEIIPVLAITKPSEAQNLTDFTLGHVTWVNARSKKLKNDIRLAKKFCKGSRVYGAESYIRGFSGHVLDLLVIHYCGFLPLLRAASHWKDKTIIDIPNAYKGKALLGLNKSKTEGPLVLVDPVQHDRNAAASLTQENYNRFSYAAKAFLAHPSTSFFSRQAVDFDVMAKRGTVTKVRCTAFEGHEDVVGTKILKLYEHLRDALKDNGFTLTNSAWEWDKKNALLWFVTKEAQLPKTIDLVGPPAAIEKHAAAFRKKYRNTHVIKGRVVAEVQNKLRTPREVLRSTIKAPHLQEKATNIRVE